MVNARTDYYAATCPPLVLPVQQGIKEVEVCVVGGGFAGLNTALGLVERGTSSVALLEAQARQGGVLPVAMVALFLPVIPGARNTC